MTLPVHKLGSGGVVKLGRIKPSEPPVCVRFGDYWKRPEGLKGIPEATTWRAKAAQSLARMYANDRAGCCVISGKMHHLGVWSANESGPEKIILASDQEVMSQYRSICGPGDNGCYITAVLDEFQKRGLRAGGVSHKIDGYVSVDARDLAMLKTAIHLFGGVTLGIDLPSAWLNTRDGQLWDVTESRIIGGHDVAAVDYVKEGVVVSTWGRLNVISWAALETGRWVDECYAQLAPAWYADDRLAPCGVDVDGLRAALVAFGGGVVPVVPPAPVPPAPVPPAPEPPAPGPAVITVTLPEFSWESSQECPDEEDTCIMVERGTMKAAGQVVVHLPERAGRRDRLDWDKILQFIITVLPLILELIKQGKTPAEVEAVIRERFSGQFIDLTP